ncbi:hypothetical protein N7532_007312 [Penicillium argentinense]|uniref:Uncharacterized protein n=1 Tax=Penicillium argentinense TaxID=1131581 RepID=A0A9W9F7M2_9EURO|nr:uncharacterized protein N7532_007312 [Penicillium argentinense]KAJ5095021.1 hypothetical protein N7532_007312 [Penicillium argentinense]
MDSSPAREKDREKISASSPKSPKQKRSGARESTANPPPPLDWPEIDWPEIFWLGKEAQSKSATERAHIARQFHSEPIHWTFNLDKPQQEHSQDAQTTDPSPSDKNDKEKNSLYLAKTPKRKRSGARESTADLNPPILWKSYEQMLEEGQNHDAQLHTHDAQANTRDAQPDTDDLSLSSGEDLDKVDIFVTQYPPVLPIAGAPVSTTRLDVDTYLLILLVTTHEYLQNGPPFPLTQIQQNLIFLRLPFRSLPFPRDEPLRRQHRSVRRPAA